MVIYGLSSSRMPELIRYIGYTKKPVKKRLIEHVSASKGMVTHKDKWIQKEITSGNTIIAEVIDEVSDIHELKKREVQYILLLKSIGSKLVNGTKGGDGVVGLSHSNEFKEWNRSAKSKPIYCFDYKTKKLLSVFPSATQMCIQLNLTRSQVGYVLTGYRNHHKGYTFSLASACPIERPLIKKEAWNKGKSTKNLQQFKTTSVVAFSDYERLVFPTVKMACQYFGIKNHSQICRAIKFKTKLRGYLFAKYKAKDFIPGNQYVNV